MVLIHGLYQFLIRERPCLPDGLLPSAALPLTLPLTGA